MNWRKLNRILHRDIGYFFFGVTIIYALSGIALNHLNDWDPNYIITHKEVQVSPMENKLGKEKVLDLLEKLGVEEAYKKHYYPNPHMLKIFLKGGTVSINRRSGSGVIELVKRRPVFYQVNFLHYNPNGWWTAFSDIYAVALILISITGMFIVRGKKGITGRGAWLAISGLLVPILFLIWS